MTATLPAQQGFSFTLTCPYDGAPVEPVATGTSNGWETRGVARCTECHTQILIAVSLAVPNGRRRLTPARAAQLEHARTRRGTEKETTSCP